MRVDNFILAFRRQLYLQKLKKNQYIRPADLNAIQLKKLQSIIRYANDYVPYWHRLLENAKVKPEDIKHQDDLDKIPITTKIDIQNNFSDFVAQGIDPSQYKTSFTTGSTGIPLKIFRDQMSLVCDDALRQYVLLETGSRPRDKLAIIWGHSKFIEWRKTYPLVSGHLSHTIIPVDDIDIITHILTQVKPDAVLAFPSTLVPLCNRDLSGIGPKRIYAQSETLTEHCRKLVEKVFGLEVFDTYGSVEFDSLAFECEEHCGLHTLTDAAVIEFLDANHEHVASGESGETVVTGLCNYAMPLIRYELGDLGIPIDEKCSCRRAWPLIKSIEGRVDESIVLPSGKKTRSGYHIYTSEFGQNLHCVSQFQLIQDRRDRILFKVVKGKKFDPKVLERIKTGLEAYFAEQGGKLEVIMQLVDEIPQERTGKRRMVVSAIS